MEYICIDFDGTIVEHDYPRIGKPNPGAIEVIKKINEAKHKVILFTMRDGKALEEAVKYCLDNGISLYNANHNPSQYRWTKSPKVYANIYIDDAALGCPLKMDSSNKRPMVDWVTVEEWLKENQIIK